MFGLICDCTGKILNGYRAKYKHDLCSPIDRAQYVQASMCAFVSINPHKFGKTLLLLYTGHNTWAVATRRFKQKLNHDEKINYCKVSGSSTSNAVETMHTAVI